MKRGPAEKRVEEAVQTSTCQDGKIQSSEEPAFFDSILESVQTSARVLPRFDCLAALCLCHLQRCLNSLPMCRPDRLKFWEIGVLRRSGEFPRSAALPETKPSWLRISWSCKLMNFMDFYAPVGT